MNLYKTTAVAIAIAAATAVSGCGSSSSASDTHSSGSSASGVATAKAQLQQYETKPAKIGPTAPLKSAPPTGKTFVFLRCELPQCGLFSDGFKSATEALGWNYKPITFQTADPSSLIAGFKQALQLHPAAVSVAGIPQEVWQSVLPDYEAAGVPIIPLAIGEATLGKAVVGSVLTSADYIKLGAVNADWFINDSNGSGHALIVNVPTYPVLSAFSRGASAEIKKNCPACQAHQLDLAISQVAGNQVNSAIVSELQKDPSIKYVITSNGPFVNGLLAALSAAGINGIKICGNSPSIADEQALLSGTEHAFTGENYSYESWNVVDVALRHMQDLPIPADGGGAPIWLLTKANVGTPAEQMDAPAGYADQFKKLWLVGS